MTGRMLPYITMACLLSPLTYGENPAIEVIFTDQGLHYVKEIGVEWLLENLENVSPHDVHGQYSMSLFGTVYYSFVGMTVMQCEFAEPSVEFYEGYPGGILARISDLEAAVSGTWTLSYGLINEGGSFELDVQGLDVFFSVGLGRDEAGQPYVFLESCKDEVETANIHLYDGASWIVKYFVDHFKDKLRSEIKERICPLVEQKVDELQGRLQAIGATLQVNQLLAVDVPLTSDPLVSYSSLSLSLKGQFHSVTSPEDPPFEAQPFSLAGDPAHMLSLGLSEYTINSAAYTYFTSGQLQALITDNMIPPSSPFRLNTSSFGSFIPELPKMYPGMEMKLQVYARDAPEFRFKSGSVKTTLLGAIKAFAVQADGALIPLFMLNVGSIFTGKFRMAAGKLTGSVVMDNFTLTLGTSEVGPIKMASLERIMKLGIQVAGLSKLNAKLGKGIGLPTIQHARLTNLLLTVEEGFISIFSDVEIKLIRDYNVGTPWVA
ncbi:hypothetical protein NHX12_012430 [Muraenolepis orangiensis]|uniref:Bactericidal permeability-increasing protein n=1 Tax=Muraenolepis orangiensis TaxID=630683 RepID=A0A9Q0DCM4_9TELE|nr:hypothetical protein NHX12_012430 [Muraenolepis orangiensis]